MFAHKSRERNGIRAWWHMGQRACIGVEFYWLSAYFGVTVGSDDDGWNISVRIPPFALYLSLDHIGLWQPKKTHIFTWDNNRQVELPDRREFDFSISDWTIRLTPWGRWGEWVSVDPWWIRGLTLDLKRLVLGRTTYAAEELALVPCDVPMPEGYYQAVAKVQRVTRGRERWFKRTAQEVQLEIQRGIPFAGKGENSFDCGDDGLFGISGDSIDDAIRRARESVLRSRALYGHASDESVRVALGR